MREKLRILVEHRLFEIFIISCIMGNSITLGLETAPSVVEKIGPTLKIIDQVFLVIFVLELLARMFVFRLRFFSDPWRMFDFVVVAVALVPQQGAFSVMRALRILRTLRLITVVPSLKKVVAGLLSAIPGLGAVTIIMCLIFYVGSVMATKLFASQFPEFFGSIGQSAYTLFQVMTLEGWSMEVVRPVMEKFPFSWIFFIPFILITTFTMLNLFIAVIVNSMQAESETVAEKRAELGHQERLQLLDELRALRREIGALKEK